MSWDTLKHLWNHYAKTVIQTLNSQFALPLFAFPGIFLFSFVLSAGF